MDTKLIPIWENTLLKIKSGLGDSNYNTWFRDLCLDKVDGETAHITCPNDFTKNWIDKKYTKTIISSLQNSQPEINVRTIKLTVSRIKRKAKDTSKQFFSEKTIKLPVDGLYVCKESGLNKKFSVENFVVCPYNELVVVAAKNVIKNLGGTYNPFFIYGKSGIGKTHIAQAIGNAVKDLNEEIKVLYVTSENFIQDCTNAIKDGSMGLFKSKYRSCDLLIVDDVQFFTGKEKMEEEFFHTINDLHNNNKQIILTSDNDPNSLIPSGENRLKYRLKSRFSQGMMLDMHPLGVDDRKILYETKLQQKGFDLGSMCLDWLAENTPGNVREIEGIINKINLAKERGASVNLDTVKTFVSSVVVNKSQDDEVIIKQVSNFYKVNKADVLSKIRKKDVVKARQVIMFLLREYMGISFSDIGDKVGGKDHTTVLHSYDKIKKLIKDDPVFNREMDQIKNMLDF